MHNTSSLKADVLQQQMKAPLGDQWLCKLNKKPEGWGPLWLSKIRGLCINKVKKSRRKLKCLRLQSLKWRLCNIRYSRLLEKPKVPVLSHPSPLWCPWQKTLHANALQMGLPVPYMAATSHWCEWGNKRPLSSTLGYRKGSGKVLHLVSLNMTAHTPRITTRLLDLNLVEHHR